ncbi:Wzz/FepE/Etk N-terminal domain-containing protein [Phreatobacter aquaticus]|nr:Wzz/FepE/Etk N-terminal domain-containing protein [Phreatobacter aquaticus]
MRGSDSRSIRLWPIPDAQEDAPDDGPIALLRSVLEAVGLHKWKLALWTALCLAIAFAYVSATPSTYTATSTILLEPRRQIAASGRETAPTPSLDLNRADSELQVIRSERLLTQVFDSLDLANQAELKPRPPGFVRRVIGTVRAFLSDPLGTIETMRRPTGAPTDTRAATAASADRQSAFAAFAQRFSARRVGQSYVVEMSYSSSDPDLAARVANAAASAYLLQSVAFKADAARSGVEFVQGRVDALGAQARAAAAAVKAGTLPDVPIPDADARVIGAALKPLGPSAPRSTLILALGGALGLMSGLFGIALASSLDRRVRNAATLTRETGLPCLAVVPAIADRSGVFRRNAMEVDPIAAFEPGSRFASAISNLRMSIKMSAMLPTSSENHTIALVSWAPDTGCSLLCLTLAELTRRLGKPVTVVDADVQGAHLSPSWGDTHGGSSLVGVLASHTPLHAIQFQNRDGVAVLPALTPDDRPDASVDFGDRSVGHLLDQLRARGDVLLALPPVADTADAAALARHADAVIIVVAAGRTTIDEVKDAARALRSVGAHVIGAVINGAQTRS